MTDGQGMGGGVYAILAIVVVLLIVIILFLTGTLGGRQPDTGPDLEIDIDVPETPQPQAPQPGN
jgi:hypothetical protein